MPLYRGWHAIVRKEVSKIHAICEKMFLILKDIRHENQPSAEEYLTFVWKKILELTGHPESENIHSKFVLDRFASYIKSEEIRLRKKLKAMNYDINDLDTVKILVGPGRIEKVFHFVFIIQFPSAHFLMEKNVFLLLRLLLERHLKVFELSKELTLHHYELIDAAESIFCVLVAVYNRYQDLKGDNSPLACCQYWLTGHPNQSCLLINVSMRSRNSKHLSTAL